MLVGIAKCKRGLRVLAVDKKGREFVPVAETA
jgi:hypothetical protein